MLIYLSWHSSRRTRAETLIPVVARTSYRSTNQGFALLSCRDHRTGESSLGAAEQCYKLIFFIKLMSKGHEALTHLRKRPGLLRSACERRPHRQTGIYRGQNRSSNEYFSLSNK